MSSRQIKETSWIHSTTRSGGSCFSMACDIRGNLMGPSLPRGQNVTTHV